MRWREFITLVAGAAVVGARAARAQRGATKRIGVLMPESEGSADSNARIVVFENTFKQLGWTPGRNLQIDYRWAMGDIKRTHALAADLVNSTPDALAAVSTPSLAAIQKATHKIPIVFVAASEPVANGFVPSLARPGGNATGFSNLEPSIGGKWLELIKGIAPRVSRV
jgi:putative tryptophan/tyrosine transport system substrate-binding protein